MSAIESTLHSPGIKIYRVKGAVSGDDIETWRDEVEAFVKENEARTACGLLIDLIEADSISTDAIDGLMDILGEPDEVLDEDMRIRFALIGVKPFTQRFFRESMSQNTMKNFRARFFHEVAEEEAIAWLQAMVTTATEEAGITDEEPAKKDEKLEKTAEADASQKADDTAKSDGKVTEKPQAEKPQKEQVEKAASEAKSEDTPDTEKGDDKPAAKEKAEEDKKKSGIGALLGRSTAKEKTADTSKG